MRPFIRSSLIALLICCLSACGLNNLVNSPENQRQEALDTFVQAMRLGEFKVASTFLAQKNQASFLDQFETLKKDLSFVEVRIEEITVIDEGERVDVDLELDYFLLPSVTVKTFLFYHTWVYEEEDKNQPAGYVIETAFPPFP